MLAFFKNKYVWGGLIVLALIGAGFWAGRATIKPQIVDHYTVDSLSVHQRDSIQQYWKAHANIITKTVKVYGKGKCDTLYQTDTTEVAAWVDIVGQLQRQLEEVSNQTAVVPKQEIAVKSSFGILLSVDGPCKWPYSPQRLTVGPLVRIKNYEIKIIPTIGYDWHSRGMVAGIAYRQSF